MSTADLLFYISLPVLTGVVLLIALISYIISKFRKKNDTQNEEDKDSYHEEISINDYIGMMGESEVDLILREIQEEIGGEVYKNLILKNSLNHYTEIDNIYVSLYGIFIIETKTWSGIVKGDYDDNEWENIFGRGNIVYRRKNPFKQNRGHIKFFKQVICKNCKITPVVVFIKDRIESIESKDVVLSDKLKGFILEHKYQIMDKTKYDYIVKRLNEFRDHPVLSHKEYVKLQKERFE